MNKILLGLVALSAVVFAEVNLKSCAGCHGTTWEKKAMGKSAVVADMNASAITTALLGYKDGTYGGAMKGLMKSQVARYSAEDLNATALLIVEQSKK